MATFEAKIHSLRIEPHPNADLLELAAIGGYRAVVQKGKYKDGDLAAYIPEGAIVPNDVIAELGLEGRLAGSKANRVKAIKLRGVLSQGLVYPINGERFQNLDADVPKPVEGDSVTLILGLAKYEPPIPTHMQGEVENAFGMTLRYDIEDVKKWPDVLEEGEPVRMTEKLHGTWCCLGWHPDHGDGPIVSSKGMSAKGLVFKLNEANENNLYVRAWREHEEAFHHLRDGTEEGPTVPFYLLGEIFGPGVQDMHYGAPAPAFRIFDIYVGPPTQGYYLPAAEFEEFVDGIFPTVPILYEGPYSHEAMLNVTTGQTTVKGGLHLREGAVIRPVKERRHTELGRVILKSVSGDYLTRRRGKRRKRKKERRSK